MYVVSISVDSRKENIPEVQEVLTKYGEKISTRLGIHNNINEHNGIIITIYTQNDVEDFVEELNTISGTSVNYMEIM